MTTAPSHPTMRQRLARAGSATGLAVLGIATIGGGFALWQETAVLPTAHDFQTGSLSVDALGDGEWLDEATGASMTETPAYPGAKFAFIETVEIGIDGNLTAELTADELVVTGDGDLPDLVETGQVITVDGQTVAAPLTVTADDDGLLAQVEMTVEIPEDVEVGMGETLGIGTVEVWLQQVTD